MSIVISKTCLFCLKTVDYFDKNANQRKEACFQRFFSFLTRLFRQTLSPWMSRNTDFHKSLNLCEDCGKIVDSFCAVYHQIRCLELELNWKLETLRNVMKQEVGVPFNFSAEDCGYESKVKCEGGGAHGGEASTEEVSVTKTDTKFRATREDLMRQCTNYLSNSFPRIVIRDNCGSGRSCDATPSSSRPSTRQTSSEINARTRDDDDPDLLQTWFFGWTISFVTVVLLFLLDSNTNTASHNLNCTQAPVIDEAEPCENYADFNCCDEDNNDENMGEVEWECEEEDENDREVNDVIENVSTETISNVEGALEEVEQSRITEELFINQNHQWDSLVIQENDMSFECATSQLKDEQREQPHDNIVNMDSSHVESLVTTQERRITEEPFIKQNHQRDGLTADENDKSLESATSQVKDEKAKDNIVNIDLSSHGESLVTTQEHEENPPISTEENPEYSSDSSDTLIHTKQKDPPGRPPKVCPTFATNFNFQCPKCPRKYRSRNVLQKHIRTHININCFKTKICEDGLTIRQLIERKHGKFECSAKNCTKKFSIREDLNKHSKLHAIFPCNFCDQIADFAPDLAIHEAQFHATMPLIDSKPGIQRLNCARCESKTFSKFRYLHHFLEEHLGINYDKIRCPVCQVSFDGSTFPWTLARNIYSHFTTQHGKPASKSNGKCNKSNGLKQCPKCPAYFLTSTQLTTHNERAHIFMRKGRVHSKGSQKSFSCDKCLQTFRFKANFESHMLSHRSAVPAIVDDALKKVVQEQGEPVQLPSRPRQLRNIHKCSVCKRTFSNLSNLESHQETCHLDNEGRGMTSDEDNEDYECKLEVKRFKREEIDDADDFNMEWKDESAESDVSSLCDGKDLEIDLGPPGSELQEASETSSSQSQTDSGQDQKAVAKHSLESQPQPLEDTHEPDNNSKSPSKSVKLLRKEWPGVMKQCPQCPFKYSNLKDFITHMHTHYDPVEKLNFKITPEGLTLKEFVFRKKGKFSCRVKVCGKKFQTEDDFSNHSKLHGSFACSVCGTVKKFAPDLAIHEANHRKEIVEKYSRHSKKKISHVVFNCARCPHNTTQRHSFIDHLLKTHLGISNDKLRCTICNAIFSEPAPGKKNRLVRGIYMHYANHHGGAPGIPLNTSVHKCDKCPAYFLKFIQLETHSAKEHGSGSRKKESSTCSDCGKTLFNRQYLRIHREKVHKVETRIACPVEDCDKRFETEVDLEHHTISYHSSGHHLYPCPICGKRMRKENLRMHLPIHDHNHKKKLAHKNKIMCDQCGKAFKSTEDHRVHLLSHSGPESWEFTCETCGKKCISKQKLTEHQRVHTKEKPFVCDTCGQAYAHRHNLRIHVNNKHEQKDIARVYDKWGYNN